MYLDELPLLYHEVGYGALGRGGDLGYENARVMVRGTRYEHAFSAHAPSCLQFDLGGTAASFRCQVAINDGVAANRTYADFSVVADGTVIAIVPNVGAGEPPRTIAADVTGVSRLALVAQTRLWEHCHSVWLDPEVSVTRAVERPATDALGRVDVDVAAGLPATERCIATVVSPGYAHLLDDMFASLAANGRCDDAIKVVFGINLDDQCRRVIARHGALAIRCRPRARMEPAIKAVVYSVARFVDAAQFLCLDADTLILGDLRPVFDAIPACAPGSILVCRDAFLGQGSLLRELCTHYAGRREDFDVLLGRTFDEPSYPLAVNDGVFAGGRAALVGLDQLIRNMPNAIGWIDQRPDHGWRNQFVFNLALARMNCGVELDVTYNLQVHMSDVDLTVTSGRVEASWRGRPVRVLHFCGWGRDRYPECRGLYATGHLAAGERASVFAAAGDAV
jgi:hypothetical protein